MLNLQVVVSNKAVYNFGSGITSRPIVPKPYPVKINVINQREGPRFQPKVKVVTISEDHTTISLSKVITTYTAIDSDTLVTATNVRYDLTVPLTPCSLTQVACFGSHVPGFSYSQVRQKP